LHFRAQPLTRQILRRKFSFAISFVVGFSERGTDEMPEIAGQMKNERTGGVRYTGRGLPQRSIVRVRGDFTIESAQLAQNHYANRIADNKKVLGHDADNLGERASAR